MSDDDVIQGVPLPPGMEPVRVPSRPASAVAQFLSEMGRDSFKNSAPALNDVLSKVLTLNTAVFGGGLAGAVGFKDAVPFWGVLAALCLVLGSVVAALAGLYPRRWAAAINDPDSVYAVESAVIEHKARCLKWAFGLLVAGLATAVLAVVSLRV